MQKESPQAPRRALSATRALKVLDFLAAHHSAAHTMSEIARGTAVNVASIHAILGALQLEGYVTRDPERKTYRLGFVPVIVGHAALEAHPVIDQVRTRASELSRALDLECLGGVIAGTEFLIVAEAGRAERLHLRPRVGQRLPYAPPLGILAAAHESSGRLEAWLDRIGPGADHTDRERYRLAAEALRHREYEIGLYTPTRRAIGMTLAQLNSDPRNRALRHELRRQVAKLAREDHQLLDPEPEQVYVVDNIQTAIFDRRGGIVAGLTLVGFDQPLRTHQIEHYIRTLTETANRITDAIGGRRPA